jgi:hypothetical protein
MINRIVDCNSQAMTAARHQVRHSGVLMLLMAIGFLVFAVFAQVQLEGSFLPYFFGFMGALLFVFGILRLNRKEQYPRPDQEQS